MHQNTKLLLPSAAPLVVSFRMPRLRSFQSLGGAISVPLSVFENQTIPARLPQTNQLQYNTYPANKSEISPPAAMA